MGGLRAGFGSAERKNVKKVFISHEHMKIDLHGYDSPGPAMYTLKSTMGKQDDGRMVNPPTWAFSTAPRAQRDMALNEAS
ncbi:MAG: hypothetical protein ACPGSK_05780, partial [Alphaproteobacteria bacterium]